MVENPRDFSDIVKQERERLDLAARVDAQELVEQRQKETLARQQQSTELEANAALMHLLRLDASSVAAAAYVREPEPVPEDAVIGWLLPRYVGWLVDIGVQVHESGEGYGYRSYSTVDALVLTPQGRLYTTKPVGVRQRDHALTSRPALEKVVRRSWGMDEIMSVNEFQFDVRQQQLARFVISNELDV